MLLAGSSAPRKDSPFFGSIVTKLRPTEVNMASHVWLQKFGGGAAPADASYLTGGHLGMGHAPLLLGERHDDNPGSPGFHLKVFETADDVSLSRLQSRWKLWQHIDPVTSSVTTRPQAATLQKLQERAFTLLHGPEARRAFDVEQESASMRDRYGRHPFGQNLLMARRLIESGVRLVNVVAWMGLAPAEKFASVETWDMHGNAGIGIFDNGWNGLGWALPRADASVATLLEDLSVRGMLESTLVVLVGEFGRTPRISTGASAIGRDHWPQCYFSIWAGAGVRGGQVIGDSDKTGSLPLTEPITPGMVGATMLDLAGVSSAKRAELGVLTGSRVIHELF